MTILEALNRIDALKFNTYTISEKMEWLSTLDSYVKSLIIDNHEGGEAINFAGYDDKTDINTVLLVPAPFDEIYLRWMESQINYHNGELDKYNASIVLYNTVFDSYANFYKRNHKPLSRGNRFIF